ncbi:putative mitochondrial protein [Cucumis melo var. makuwa]|uniref:Mitochondrial protein n=1 Tax=Cucumis melo var. makuwa TaxID=1194695 RepID=A0A5D3E714_CUCMM|nr:putative mitochondrial protein [Cucumis melo var. makuwa]TYK31629.1 putative mitochondrial protein [Cucumis melo var. makuwa]
MVKKFGIDKLKPKRALVASHTKIPRDDSREKVDESMYRNIIGSLLYLTAKKPDIAFVVEIGQGVLRTTRVLWVLYVAVMDEIGAFLIAPTVPYKTSVSDAPSASVCPPHSSNIGSSPIGLLIDSPVDDFTFNAFDSFIDPIVPDISLILLIQLMILLTCLLQPSLSLLCPYSCWYNFN